MRQYMRVGYHPPVTLTNKVEAVSLRAVIEHLYLVSLGLTGVTDRLRLLALYYAAAPWATTLSDPQADWGRLHASVLRQASEPRHAGIAVVTSRLVRRKDRHTACSQVDLVSSLLNRLMLASDLVRVLDERIRAIVYLILGAP